MGATLIPAFPRVRLTGSSRVVKALLSGKKRFVLYDGLLTVREDKHRKNYVAASRVIRRVRVNRDYWGVKRRGRSGSEEEDVKSPRASLDSRVWCVDCALTRSR